jgi:hypothetical protein
LQQTGADEVDENMVRQLANVLVKGGERNGVKVDLPPSARASLIWIVGEVRGGKQDLNIFEKVSLKKFEKSTCHPVHGPRLSGSSERCVAANRF